MPDFGPMSDRAFDTVWLMSFAISGHFRRAGRPAIVQCYAGDGRYAYEPIDVADDVKNPVVYLGADGQWYWSLSDDLIKYPLEIDGCTISIIDDGHTLPEATFIRDFIENELLKGNSPIVGIVPISPLENGVIWGWVWSEGLNHDFSHLPGN